MRRLLRKAFLIVVVFLLLLVTNSKKTFAFPFTCSAYDPQNITITAGFSSQVPIKIKNDSQQNFTRVSFVIKGAYGNITSVSSQSGNWSASQFIDTYASPVNGLLASHGSYIDGGLLAPGQTETFTLTFAPVGAGIMDITPVVGFVGDNLDVWNNPSNSNVCDHSSAGGFTGSEIYIVNAVWPPYNTCSTNPQNSSVSTSVNSPVTFPITVTNDGPLGVDKVHFTLIDYDLDRAIGNITAITSQSGNWTPHALNDPQHGFPYVDGSTLPSGQSETFVVTYVPFDPGVESLKVVVTWFLDN